MSGNNNSEVNGMIVTLAIIGVAIAYMAIAFAIFLALYSAVMTVVAFWAWNKPRKFIKWTVYPFEARAYVFSGMAGAFIVPLMVMLVSTYAKFTVADEYIWPIIILGYAIGSNISAWVTNQLQEEMQAGQGAVDVTPAIPALPPSKANDDDAQGTFEFATWDDEERR
jgi:hypothetical protein